jgi:hypothetical protein
MRDSSSAPGPGATGGRELVAESKFLVADTLPPGLQSEPASARLRDKTIPPNRYGISNIAHPSTPRVEFSRHDESSERALVQSLHATEFCRNACPA